MYVSVDARNFSITYVIDSRRERERESRVDVKFHRADGARRSHRFSLCQKIKIK